MLKHIFPSSHVTKIIIVLFIFNFSFSQDIIISTPNTNKLYFGIPNLIKVYVKNVRCEDLNLRIDGKLLEKKGCEYIISPDLLEPLRIEIFDKQKKISNYTFKVEEIEFSLELRAPKNNEDELLLKRAIGLSVTTKNINLNIENNLIQFDFIIIRDDKVYFKERAIGGNFDDRIKSELNNLCENDMLIFTNIKLEGKNKFYKLNDLVFNYNR